MINIQNKLLLDMKCENKFFLNSRKNLFKISTLLCFEYSSSLLIFRCFNVYL